jgi:DNA-directed RNA polymerase specialized sigma24 family protein
VLILSGLDRVRSTIADSILAELNFHRDALAFLKLPIVIWLNNQLLSRLPGIAPDFWSRRTAVYRFTPEPTKELLARLFSLAHKDLVAHQPSTIGKAIKDIIDAERILSKCLRTRFFAVEEADALIAIIQDNIRVLRNEGESGRQIDIAMHLWNIGQVDKQVERFVKELNASDRNIFEYVYTDRNEALLHVAQETQTLLTRYLDELPVCIQKRRRPTLVGLFYGVAIDRLNQIARDLESSVGVSIDQLEPWLADVDHQNDDDDPRGPQDTVESAIGAQASYELESWLRGYNDHLPAIFSESEGKLLKALYSQLTQQEIAEQMGLKLSYVRKLVHELEEKVRLFLLTSETRTRSLPS